MFFDLSLNVPLVSTSIAVVMCSHFATNLFNFGFGVPVYRLIISFSLFFFFVRRVCAGGVEHTVYFPCRIR